MNWIGWCTEINDGVGVNHSLEDCAILVCCYGRRVCEGLPLSFGVETMGLVRQQMIEELKSGSLQELLLPPGKVSTVRTL